jgi:preprotein translocase subunit SecE
VGAEVKAMEIKNVKPTTAAESQISSHKVQNFVAELKNEIHLVHWTSRNELIAYAKIVVIATFMMGMSIYLLDLLTQTTLSALSHIMRYISG